MNGFSNSQRYWLGALCLIFFTVHGAVWTLRGVPANMLWACHIGCVLVGMGFFCQSRLCNSIGVLWLVLGNIMWVLYLLGGGEFDVTSPLTHIGGLIIGCMGVRKAGISRFSWMPALAGMVILQQFSRMVTPEKENINLAFKVHPGWEHIFTSYTMYFIALLFQASITFIISGWILQKVQYFRK